VQTVDTALVMKAIQPIWKTKTETAKRVQGRIEKVLGWATTSTFREGDNPARWHGHLENLLAAPSEVQPVERHPALPCVEIGAFVAELQAQRSIGALALEFTILTAARTGQVIGAQWPEVDLQAKVWAVPAERMKGSNSKAREHRVLLSPRSIAILQELKRAGGKYVFPGLKPGKPLSNMAMLAVVKRMNDRRSAAGQPRWTDPKEGNKDVVPHGFRSTFKDWARERTNFAGEVSEAALAHIIFEKRRRLMDEWAKFCSKPAAGGDVVPIRAKAST
jgi:integrase